jgi:polyphosphate kinase 2 (PPK2 family)
MKSYGFLVQPGMNIKLNKCNPAYIANKKDKESVESELSHYSSRMSELQYKLFADKHQSLLIILQGIDASGKDGTIRHVMGTFNPQSCRVESFKEPSSEDLSHDYLWRIHRLIPSKGDVSIFNRSHYGDVIEVRVHNLVPKSEWSKKIQTNQ